MARGGPGAGTSAPKRRRYTALSGSQAKRSLDLHQKVGGAGGGYDLANRLAASGDATAAAAARKRVAAIRAARASGNRAAYKTAVQENRQARLDYNTRTLGLNNGPGKPARFAVGSKETTRKRLRQRGANRRLQRVSL